jgi:hypothetical protein
MSGSGVTATLECTQAAPPNGSFAVHGLTVDVIPNGPTLVFARARHYDLQLGRWLQRDPKGNVDGPNLYEAFGGNLLANVDPMGTRYKLASGWNNGDEVYWQDYGLLGRVDGQLSVGTYLYSDGQKYVVYRTLYPDIDDPVCPDFYLIPLSMVEQWSQRQLDRDEYDKLVRVYGLPYGVAEDGKVRKLERSLSDDIATGLAQLSEPGQRAFRSLADWAMTDLGELTLQLTRGVNPISGYNVTEKDAKDVVAQATWYIVQAALAKRLIGPTPPGGVPPWLAQELEGGGSWLMTEEQFTFYAKGARTIGRVDGQFMISARRMNQLIHETGGDPVQLGKRLGIRSWGPETRLIRMDASDPLRFNPRASTRSMSGANSLYRPGGFTSGGVPECVTDPFPWYQVWSMPVP